MRILFVTPHQLWPVNSGARLRSLHLSLSLAERCAVTLFQVVQPREEPVYDPRQSAFEEVITCPKERSYAPVTILKGLVGPTPLTILNYDSPAVEQSLADLLARRSFDTVQIEGSHLSPYLPTFRKAAGPLPVLHDWHNIESELLLRYSAETVNLPKKLVARRTATLLQKLEARLTEECDFHTVVSDRDQRQLLEWNRNAKVRVVPNGVDAANFTSTHLPGASGSLLFVGSMDYHANIDAVTWFTREAWPPIAARFPELQFKIVGRSPAPAVRTLDSTRIEVTGTVPDVRPFYESAVALIVPLRVGGGTRLKILEAMAMGVPVISTRVGAEGIAACDGKNILLADSPAEMLSSLERLDRDRSFRTALAESARQLVLQQYDWSSIGRGLFEIHSELVGARVLS